VTSVVEIRGERQGKLKELYLDRGANEDQSTEILS
jgi:hypothetical protein